LDVHERRRSQTCRSEEFELNVLATSREEQMCPACIASAALIITGIVSTGGLTALAAKKFHRKNAASERGSCDSHGHRDSNTKSDIHGKEQL
jgi:hypothetical protein